MQTPRDAVRQNVRDLRERRRHTVRSLSVRMGELGRPLLPSGITKIEDGTRRVDADDLVALAVALGVNPSRLLMPARADDEPIALTDSVSVPAWQAWQWADGRYPLPTRPGDDLDDPYNTDEDYADFQQFARPEDLRVREQHTAVRAAQDVAFRLHRLLSAGDAAGTDVRRAAVRRALDRLVAEVNDLIEGEHDGQR